MAPQSALHEAAADEQTPLLNAPSHEAPSIQREETEQAATDHVDEEPDRPFPWVQHIFLCFARLTDPLCFFCIFPFVNEMIYKTGDVAETDVGFYSGLIESLFSVAQMFTMIFWGRMSDRFGRKPILVISLIGLACTVTLFGFSKKIWQMILFRCLAGGFSGTVVTIRTMVGEQSTPATQARAYSYFSFAGNLGIFLGPIIGGGLSNLASHYPSKFGHNKFLINYPYALPTITTGAYAAFAATIAFFFIEETLKPESRAKNKKKSAMSTMEILKSPGVPYVLYLWSFIALQGFAYTALAPVFWFTSIRLGGYSFDEREISLFLSINGISQAVWILVIFPPLQRRVGTGNVLRLCSWVYPFFYAVGPVLNQFRRHGWDTAFWAIGTTLLVIGSGISMNFTAGQLVVNDVSPSPQVMGTLNALALTLLALTRSIIPGTITSIFAIGVKHQILQGQLAWFVMIILAIIMAISMHWIPEKAEGRPKGWERKTGDEEASNGSVGVVDREGQSNGDAHGRS